MITAKLIVLATINRSRKAHGYKILEDLKRWRIETWTNTKPGSIYHAIDKLEQQKYITATKPTGRKLGPGRTEYRITKTGQNALRDLLEEALYSFDNGVFSASIVFMDMLDRDVALRCLMKRKAAATDNLNFLKTLPAHNTEIPSEHPELTPIWIDYLESVLKTTDRIITHINAGNYTFNKRRD